MKESRKVTSARTTARSYALLTAILVQHFQITTPFFWMKTNGEIALKGKPRSTSNPIV
jgi:hypothetical protein